MLKFFYKLLIFVFLLILADYFVALFLSYNRPIDYKCFVDSRKEFFEQHKKVDVLFIGDSHIADALDVKIVEEECKLSAYNLGIYHASPYDNYFLLKKIISEKLKPKVLVFGTNPDMLTREVNPSKYMPIILNDFLLKVEMSYRSEEKFDPYLFIKSQNEKYLFDRLIKNLLGEKYIPTRNVSGVYNGYLNFSNQSKGIDWTCAQKQIKEKTEKTTQKEYLDKLIQLAQDNDIKVVFINPPIWKCRLEVLNEKSESFKRFNNEIKVVKSKYKLNVFNEENNSLDSILLQEDFLNLDHLNSNGAKKNTEAFCNWYNNL